MDAAPVPALAFGVDPTRRELYSLRQARYHAIGQEIAGLLPDFQRRGERLRLLDVGVWNGVSMRHIEAHDPQRTVEYHGVDLKLRPALYKRSSWASLQEGDLLNGLPDVPSDAFDVVLCEQVLEHLPEVDEALATLCRVTRPGGLMILGVPIFSPGLRLVRERVVPVWDGWFPPNKARGHLQAFSRGTFLAAIDRNCDVTIQTTRGFRMISGGLLRGLENSRRWWQLNCALGRWLPGLCTEIQVLARKNPAANTLPLPEVAACESNCTAAAA
jgi:SAM-dependent methyltransferase